MSLKSHYKARDPHEESEDSTPSYSKVSKYEGTDPKFESNIDSEKGMFDLHKLSYEKGIFAKIIGSGENALKNSAFFFISIVLIPMVVLFFIDMEKVIKYWSVFGSLVTLILGYLFGDNKSK